VAGTQHIFVVATAITLAGVALSWFIRQVPLRESVAPEPAAAPEETAEALGI
jgi:hypothetical protein